MATTPSELAEHARRLHGLGRHQEAIETLQGVLAQEPTDLGATELLVQTLLEVGRPEEALARAHALVRALPDQPEPHRLVGDALFRLGRVSEASDALHRADELGAAGGPRSGRPMLTFDGDEPEPFPDDDLEGEPTQIHVSPGTPPRLDRAAPTPDVASLFPDDAAISLGSATPLDAAPGIPTPNPEPAPPSSSLLPPVRTAPGPLGSPAAAPLGSPLASLPAPNGAPPVADADRSGTGRLARLGTKLILGLLIAGALGAGGWFLVRWAPWERGPDTETVAAIDAAVRDGSLGALADVAARIRSVPGTDALRAAILVTILHEHGEGEPRVAAADLPDVGGGLAGAVARVHLALVRGDVAGAQAQADALPSAPEDRPDLRFMAVIARAQSRLAGGDGAGAVQILAADPSVVTASPRAATLLALARAAQDGPRAGLNALPTDATTPGARTVRGLLLADVGERSEEAEEMLRGVRDGGQASPVERALAERGLAELALRRGATAAAREHGLASWSASPRAPVPGRTVRLARLLVDAGASDEDLGPIIGALGDAGDDPAIGLIRVDAALAAGRLSDAEALLEKAPRPLPPPWLLRAGRIAAERGDRVAAQRHLEALAAEGAARAEGRTALARLAIRSGQSDAAVGLLEEAIAEAPGDPDAVPMLVDLLLQRGDVPGALETAREGLDARPDHLALVRALGSAQLAAGDVEDATPSLRRAAEARPRDLTAQLAFARAARRGGRRGEADAALGRALEVRPDHPEALAGRFDLALLRNDPDAAEAIVASASSQDVSSELVASFRARLAVHRGLGAVALNDAFEAARRHPSASLAAAIGALSLQAGDRVEAGRWFERAVALDPSMPEAHVGLARVRILRGDVGSAARSLGEAERLAGEQGRREELAVELALARAWVHYQVGNLMDADREGRRAVQLDEDDGRAHHVVAQVVLARAEDSREPLRAAVAGHHPPPEALALYALRRPSGVDVCALADKARRRGPSLAVIDRLRALDCPR